MKQLFSLLIAVLLAATVYAQAPQQMSYQAVVRNASGELVSNQAVGMRISILQGSIDGTAVYSEVQTPTTNVNGLVSIAFGGQTGFENILWSEGPYFLKTETDPTGGAIYTISGTSQLLSVPYAFAAGELLLNKGGKNYKTYMKDNGTYIGLPAIIVEHPFADEPTVTDVDGNTYGTVKIGSQVWMTENLRVTKYNDNTPIPLVTIDSVWSELTTPGYCFYDNTSNIDTINAFGALYNWHVVETDKLCPTGWHVPSDAEWSELTDYLGVMAGGRLKESATDSWASPNTDAIDDTHFTALPGGYRHNSGTFYNAGSSGYWWGSTENFSSYAFSRSLGYDRSDVYRGSNTKSSGVSVRCVRD
jgi:uncharacterized protein (TIGR02145 family)